MIWEAHQLKKVSNLFHSKRMLPVLRDIAVLFPGILIALRIVVPMECAAFDAVPRVMGSVIDGTKPIVHDVDLDGDLDVIYGAGRTLESDDGEIGWFENASGDGRVWTRWVIASGLRRPVAIALADLDGDGRSDLVVALSTSSSIVWMKGGADGGFADPVVIYEPIQRLSDVCAGDLNGDGLMDLVIGERTASRWLRQQAGFRFSPPIKIADRTSVVAPVATTVADLDRDGDLDVLTSFGSDQDLAFSRNNGGAFSPPVSLGVRSSSTPEVGDLDGDGWPDIVALAQNVDLSRRVFWLRNNGDGTFAPHRDLTPRGRLFGSPILTDFDRDGDPDVVLPAGDSPPLWWVRNVGGGQFAPPATLSTDSEGLGGLTVGDFDGDGDPDPVAIQSGDRVMVRFSNLTPPPAVEPPRILSFTADDTSVASEVTLRWATSGAESVEILPGIGEVSAEGSRTIVLSDTRTFVLAALSPSGSVTEEITIVVGEKPVIRRFEADDPTIAPSREAVLTWDVVGADEVTVEPGPGAVAGVGSHGVRLTESTSFDLRATNEFGESTVRITVEVGDAPAVPIVQATPSNISLNDVSVLTWSAPGADSVFVSEVGDVPTTGSASVQPASTRRYRVTATNAFGSTSREVTVTVTGLQLPGEAVFLTSPNGGYEPWRIAFADLDADGLNDLVMSGEDDFGPFPGFMVWQRRIGPAEFDAAVEIVTDTRAVFLIRPHDFDRDGDLDPVFASNEFMNWVPNLGDGRSYGPVRPMGAGFPSRRRSIADFNGDGLDDYVGHAQSSLHVSYGTGVGEFGPSVLLARFGDDIEFVFSDVADLDGDGDTDIVAGKDGDGVVYWFVNDDGDFAERRDVLRGAARILGIAAEDTDQDGDSDILIQTDITRLELVVNPGDGNFISGVPRQLPHGITNFIRDFELADLDLDGDTDLVVLGSYAFAQLDNRGGNQFVRISNPRFETGWQVLDLELEDVDGDGDRDVVMASDRVSQLFWVRNEHARRLRPVAVEARPIVELAEDFGVQELPLGPFVSDPDTPDGDLVFSIESAATDAVLESFALEADGRVLRVHSAPDRHGSAEFLLRVTDPDGMLTEFQLDLAVQAVPDAPRASAPPPILRADAEGAPVEYAVGLLFTDPDEGDVLTYGVSGNSNPVVTDRVELDPESGALEVVFAPYVSGTTTLEIVATDRDGLSARLGIPVVLPDLPAPSLAADAPLVLNRQTGLFEKRVTVTNVAARPLGGFRLAVADLPAGVKLHNAATENGIVDWLTPIPAGESAEILLEFHAAGRASAFEPRLTVSPALPAQPPTADGEGLAVERCLLLADGGVLVEFASRAGQSYEILYSDDAAVWKLSPVSIRAAANRVQWIDRGPPWTDAPPTSKAARYYRVREIVESGPQ